LLLHTFSAVAFLSQALPSRSAPDPAELHHGRRLTVKAWFDELEAYSCATRDSSVRDKGWYFLLRYHCQDHSHGSA